MGKWFTFAPVPALLIEGYAPERVINISDHLRIEKIPEWAVSDEALQILDGEDRKFFRSERCCICSDYDADALHSPDPEWKGAKPLSIQRSRREEIVVFGLSLWIVSPSGFLVKMVGHINVEPHRKILLSRSKIDPIRVSDDSTLQVISRAQLDSAIAIHRKIMELDRKKTVWTAFNILSSAVSQPQWNVHFLLYVMALESLFGPENGIEITFRLSTRVARFFHDAPEKAEKLFKQCKVLYKWRSQIVHGMRLKKLSEQESEDLMNEMEQLIRDVFKKILLEDYIAIFDGSSREESLDKLLFRPLSRVSQSVGQN